MRHLHLSSHTKTGLQLGQTWRPLSLCACPAKNFSERLEGLLTRRFQLVVGAPLLPYSGLVERRTVDFLTLVRPGECRHSTESPHSFRLCNVQLFAGRRRPPQPSHRLRHKVCRVATSFLAPRHLPLALPILLPTRLRHSCPAATSHCTCQPKRGALWTQLPGTTANDAQRSVSEHNKTKNQLPP